MMRQLIFLLVTLSLSAPAIAQAPQADCRIADTAISVSMRLRKLKMKREVPCRLQGRKEVEEYLRTTLNERVPPPRVENEGKVYELLGIVPLGFDYLNQIIKLYSEQLGGYYDPKLQSYVMASWLPAAMQMTIAVHELTHALQDQHFDLDGMMDEINDPSDVLLARAALVEGDATLVMFEYARETARQPPLIKEPSVSSVMMQNIAGAMMSSSLSKAPSGLQAMLIFPYVSGLRFAHTIVRRDGIKGMNSAFANPPRSTEEILHPKLYGTKSPSFTVPELPLLPDGLSDGSPPAFEDRLGEFTISTLLGTFTATPDASRASSGWGGDRLAYYPRAGKRYGILAWRTAWDTKRDADEFSETLKKAYTKRFKVAPNESKNSAIFSGTDVGQVEIRMNGKSVDLLIY